MKRRNPPRHHLPLKSKCRVWDGRGREVGGVSIQALTGDGWIFGGSPVSHFPKARITWYSLFGDLLDVRVECPFLQFGDDIDKVVSRQSQFVTRVRWDEPDHSLLA